MLNSGLRHTLIGKALMALAGVFAICCAVVAVGIYFKRDLDEQTRQLVRMNEREFEIQREYFAATELLVALTLPHSGAAPDAATLLDWEARLRELVEMEPAESLDASSPHRGSNLQRALVEVREIMAEPRSREQADEFAARLRPVLGQLTAGARRLLEESHRARVELWRAYSREANAGAVWMLAIGLSGFAAVCLLAGRFLFRLVRDLRRLQRRAEEISTGDYGAPLSFGRRDEVGEVGRAMDEMAEALARTKEEIENSRARLLESERMSALGTFAAGIAHELGNPIHAMSALVERIGASRREDPSGHKMAENLERMHMISEQIDRMNQVIREVGEFARAGPASMEATSFNQAIESAIRMSRFHPCFRGIELISDLSRDLPMMRAVPEQLTQLALNVLVKVADAAEPGGGKITVSTRRDREDVLFTVTDNRRGSSNGAAKAPLDPFSTTNSKGEGTGLGFAVCKAIVDQHRGSLEIERAPGLGTQVRVRLPLAGNGEGR